MSNDIEIAEYDNERIRLAERYDHDPRFHAVVDVVSNGGYSDDGVFHRGATVADARLAESILIALEDLCQ
jgi:hypothetical protein